MMIQNNNDLFFVDLQRKAEKKEERINTYCNKLYDYFANDEAACNYTAMDDMAHEVISNYISIDNPS